MNRKRIQWIDALRGFTMILVVLSHVAQFSFELGDSFVNEVFMSFRMPLFFFVSGFIGYKANVEWTGRMWWTMTRKKLMVQLVPTFVFGLIYTYAYLDLDFISFITNFNKLGYWFTIVLLEMFFLLYSMNFVLCKFDKSDSKPSKTLGLLFIVGCLYIVRFIPSHFPSFNGFYNILTLHYTTAYFFYFALGYICSMYKEKFNAILDKKSFVIVAMFLFAISFYVRRIYILPHLGDSVIMSLLGMVVPLIIGASGLLIVFNTFRVYSYVFSSDTQVGKSLQYIGKRTLDIYLLHYFFLPYIPQIGRMLSQGNNVALELLFGGIISLLVIGLCLVVSNVIRTSPILAKYLFGVKTNE